MERHEIIRKRFEEMGATVRISERESPWYRPRPFGVDLVPSAGDEVFTIRYDPSMAEPEVVSADPKGRHLLLMFRRFDEAGEVDSKPKFLCGHDERHWFAATVPTEGVRDVRSAREALKPEVVRVEQNRKRVREKSRDRRRNRAFLRQGEWFFLPRPRMVVAEGLILRNEPLNRGGGKAHLLEESYRTGGEEVWVNRDHPMGLTEKKLEAYLRANRKKRRSQFRQMRRNPAVFARGRVRHPDHATIRLDGWHFVVVNRERRAPHARFLDYVD
jgi:hypothetical protein